MDLLLLMACSENDTPKVEELLEAGANPLVTVSQGRSRMHCIAWFWAGAAERKNGGGGFLNE